jgi:hypothetical protein
MRSEALAALLVVGRDYTDSGASGAGEGGGRGGRGSFGMVAGCAGCESHLSYRRCELRWRCRCSRCTLSWASWNRWHPRHSRRRQRRRAQAVRHGVVHAWRVAVAKVLKQSVESCPVCRGPIERCVLMSREWPWHQ